MSELHPKNKKLHNMYIALFFKIDSYLNLQKLRTFLIYYFF